MINTSVPEGWLIGKLDDLGKWSSGGTPSSKVQKYYNGSVPWVVTGDLADGPLQKISNSITEEGLQNSSAKLFPRGTLLVAMYGATIGKLGVLTAQAATNQACAALIPSPESSEIIPYVFYFLFSHREKLRKLGQGGAQPNISQALLKEVQIPIAPLNEQKRIVDKIERLFSNLDEGEALLKQVQKQLATYRQSVLNAAVTGELTKDWREANKDRLESGKALLQSILKFRRENWQGRGKYKEPTAPDTTTLPELPDGWIWATLPQLGEFGRGKSKHRPRNDQKLYKNGSYPFLQTGMVRNSKGRINHYDSMYNDFGLKQSKLWPIGTICITIAANIAESGILEIEACFPDSIVGLIPNSKIYGDYIEFFIRTARGDLDRYAPATAQKNINLEILEKVAVPLPSNEEQKEIVDRVSNIFSQIATLESWCATELIRSTTLRQSILKVAFSGKLVPQDPADEPVSELLKRIQAQKVSMNKPPAAKRKTKALP